MAGSKRTYEVKKPVMTGADITEWHKTVIRLFKAMKIVPPLEVNNKYTANTRNVSQALATAVGLDYKKTVAGGLSPENRTAIRNAAKKKPTASVTKFRTALKKRKGWKALATPSKPSNPNATLNGLDVSSYQPANIGSAVPGEFCIVKATEGLTYVNPSFTNQLSGAKHTGKMLGLYHFATGDDAAHEAQHFYNTIRPYLGQAVMVLDFEGPALAHGHTWALAWLNEFYKLSGVKPLFYSSSGTVCIPEYADVAKKYPLWVANYPSMGVVNGYTPGVSKVDVAPWSEAVIRQYTGNGRLKGYSKPLDLDVFYGDRDMWRSLCKKS